MCSRRTRCGDLEDDVPSDCTKLRLKSPAALPAGGQGTLPDRLPVGRQYVLGLTAVNCQSETRWPRSRTRRRPRRRCRRARRGGIELRGELGELCDGAKFDVARTATIFAQLCKRSALAERLTTRKAVPALPYDQHAIEQSNFAMGHAAGSRLQQSGRCRPASEYFTKAYQLWNMPASLGKAGDHCLPFVCNRN
jgi:hypothetical protein